MKRYLTLFSAMLLFYTSDVCAQHRQADFSIPSMLIPSGIKPAQLQAKLRQVTRAVYSNPGGMLKTTAGTERLKALANYDFTMTPGNQIQDSMSFIYSPGRTSVFDFDNLTYDYFNNEDFPSPFPTGAYIQFDSLHTYVPPGSSNSSVFGVRIYNAAGKVIRDENPNVISTYIYDASNRLSRSTVMEYNPLTATWDSSFRDFYSYNVAGYLVRDSSESWNPTTSAYEPSILFRYTNNVAGYPVQILIDFFLGPIPVTVIQFDIMYGVPANRPSRAIVQINDGAGLENFFKDTIGYSSQMINFYDSYDWDTTANNWTLVYKERRRLNGASLPDSVHYHAYNNGLPVDSAIDKLAYNGQNDPIWLRSYVGSNPTPDLETRWYYEPIEGVGVPSSAARKELVIYPNPVTDKLYLKGTTEGQYYIHNAAGQVVQSGFLRAGSAVPVHLLSPGVYSITLLDGARAATFIRQ